MRTRISKYIPLVCFFGLMFPQWLWAAGGGDVKSLVHVADTRNLSGIYLYFANLYNEDLFIFAIWTVVAITALGAGFGFLMDFIMSKTGLDLTTRELHE